MHRETERIAGVVRDLLDYSRSAVVAPEAGDLQHVADVEGVVREIVSLVELQPSFRAIAVDVDAG